MLGRNCSGVVPAVASDLVSIEYEELVLPMMEVVAAVAELASLMLELLVLHPISQTYR